MRDKFVSALLEIAKKDSNVLLLTGDLGFGVLNGFWNELPKQIINLGIAEQNMIGFAAGLAKSGKTVYVYSIANFPSIRPLEQIRNDVAYHNLNVKIVSVGAGLSYGSLGMTHHAIEDVSIIRSIPNIKIYSPFSDLDTESITFESYNEHGPAYIRLGRKSVQISSPENFIFKKGKPFIVSNKSNLAIATYGDITEEVSEALLKLKSINIYFDLLIFHTLKPIGLEILDILSPYKKIVIVEEHTKYGGLGSIIKEFHNELKSKDIFSLAINDEYRFDVGDQKYLRSVHSIDADSIYLYLKDIYAK